MLKKILTLLLSIQLYTTAANNDKTVKIREEVNSHTNPNITSETHPTLYGMVQDLTSKAQIAMPRYITIYNAESQVVLRYGEVVTYTQKISSYVDTMGDLYICREILNNFQYDEIAGIVSIAIAEKAQNKPTKLATMAIGTLGITVGLAYYLNKKYNLGLGQLLFEDNHRESLYYTGNGLYYRSYRNSAEDQANMFKAVAIVLSIPSLITTKIFSNNLQKNIDLKATTLTKHQDVIDGLIKLDKIQDAYKKEGVLSRLISSDKLTQIYNILFYPARSFTTEERIDYLKLDMYKA